MSLNFRKPFLSMNLDEKLLKTSLTLFTSFLCLPYKSALSTLYVYRGRINSHMPYH